MSNFVPNNQGGALPLPSNNAPKSAQPVWKQKHIRRYGLIFLLVAAATFLMGLVIWSGYSAPTFALLYLVVLLSAWYGGLASGLVATVLSALAGAYFLMPPNFSLRLDSDLVLETGLFVAAAVLISVFGSARQRAELLLGEEIREHKQLERALAGREKQYRRIVETANEGIWTIDAWGETDYINARGADIMGYSPAEILGRSPLGFIDPEDRQRVKEGLTLSRKGVTDTREVRIRRKDGAERWIFYTTAPIFDDQERYAGTLAMFNDITDRKQADEKLQVSLQEKQALLREVNHRVKNNLQAVSNLLSLQAYTIADPEVRAKFGETQDRIRSIALLHEKLYQTQNFTHLDFAEYVTDLARRLIHSYQANPDMIRLRLDCEEIPLKVDMAVSLGIIANELISNALKHAFVPEQEGELGIILRQDEGGQLRLEVWDNGKGLPAGYNLFESRSLGLQLVQTLAGYMKGRLTVKDGPGARICLIFPPPADVQ